jgi:hypothetical protein
MAPTCAAGEFLTRDGKCEHCEPYEVRSADGMSCEACPDFQMRDDDGNCKQMMCQDPLEILRESGAK